jgi:hypothetical protein
MSPVFIVTTMGKTRAAITCKLSCSNEEVIVSFQHLDELSCIYFQENADAQIFLKPFGTLLMKVVSG